MIEVRQYGIEYLEKFYYSLNHVAMRQVVLAAFKKAYRPMLDEMKLLVPVGNSKNHLKDSLAMGVLPQPDVGVRIGARQTGGYKGYYGYVTNSGTTKERKRYRMKGSPSTGYAPKSGWFKTAVEISQQYCDDNFKNEWYNSIQRFIKRNA